MLLTLVSTLIVLGILIFVHELGHFILAKKVGVKVLKFSLGFGPRLIGKKIGETEYQIAVFPLGGFVKPLGEDPNEEMSEEDRPRSFWAQPVWKRALIICAGPFFNFFLAVVIYSAVNVFAGVPSIQPIPPEINEVTSGSPAEQAGLKKGDFVISIDGQEISTWDDLREIIHNSKGKELLLKVKRNDELLEFKVTPKQTSQKTALGEEVRYPIIGVTPPPVKEVYNKVGFLSALGNGFVQTWDGIRFTVVVVVKLLQRAIPAKTIGGPIMIAKMAGEFAKRGLLWFVSFMAILSINLGVINLFPVPILDGGHLLFLGLEAALGKPVSLRKMEIAQQVGLVLIILLMVFAFYNDILRLFSPEGFKF
ncbi:MAG TPA: RIP metalloprotease RseP [Thermodesulfobacteriota bacterium]|nr:RIP metalloprotease RseP [Thermodesulfobacteriota bacterium]